MPNAPADVAAANTATLEVPGVRVVTDHVERFLRGGPPSGIRMDLVFIDPPYDVGEDVLAGVLSDLVGQAWLAPSAFVVVERSSRSPQPTWPAGLELSGEKRYGETTVWFAEPPLTGGVA